MSFSVIMNVSIIPVIIIMYVAISNEYKGIRERERNNYLIKNALIGRYR